MRLTRTRTLRLFAAAVLVVPVLVVSFEATAAPSKEDVEQAQARLSVLQHELETSIEAYNDAAYRLQQVRDKLADAKARMDDAEAEAAEHRQALSDRAVEAYTGMGSQLDVLLDAEDFSQFSDRLTFMGAIASSDADIAAAADAARQKAEWAASEYRGAVEERDAELTIMREKRAEIESMVSEQAQLAATLGEQYEDYVAAQRQRAVAAAAAEQSAASDDGSGGTGTTFHPPPVNGAAGAAVNAAYSVLGSPYVWGAAGPNAFDCSGLTSYAWSKAGVYLPHSASAQYGSLPKVSLSDVQAGDIIYYGNFGPHVALYVGGGQIIHARNPGPGGGVQVDSMYGYDRPWGAVRPG